MADLERWLAYAVVFFGLTIAFVALPAQLRKNRNEKRCGQCGLLIGLGILMLACRMTHACVKGDLTTQFPVDVVYLFYQGLFVRQWWMYSPGHNT